MSHTSCQLCGNWSQNLNRHKATKVRRHHNNMFDTQALLLSMVQRSWGMVAYVHVQDRGAEIGVRRIKVL